MEEPPSFLLLPPAVRKRIYYHACYSVYQGWVVREVLLYGGDRDPDSNNGSFLATALALLRVCRVIHIEAKAWLYSNTNFIADYHQAQPLKPLSVLSASILRLMTRLCICLNAVTCSPPKICHYYYTWHPDDRKPLNGTSAEGLTVLSNWYNTVHHLKINIRPHILDLCLICDVADVQTAELVLAPLTELPPLVTCSIRLSNLKDPELQRLARRAAFSAVGRQPPPLSSQAFRYLDLPAELRRKILRYTDLVTPMGEVYWSPDLGYFTRYRVGSCWGPPRRGEEWTDLPPFGEHSFCPRTGHHACQFRMCQLRGLRGCLCLRYHSAYSTAPGWCRCWQPPAPFFLVSRRFRAEAAEIFFSYNRFIVFPQGGCVRRRTLSDWERGWEHLGPRFPAADFLTRGVPAHFLEYIRFLEIVVEPFDEYPPPGHSFYKDWSNAAAFARDILNLSQLTVRFYGVDFRARDVTPARYNFTPQDKMRINLVFCHLVRPLKHWASDGLERFFLYLPYPMQWRQESLGRARPRVGRIGSIISPYPELDKALEQIIMGDDYDSAAVGKNDETWSEWLEEEWLMTLG